MKKKSILLMFVVGVVFALFVAPSAALANAWTDITDAQWVEMYGVTAAQVDTVADGYGDGTFGPGNQVTRGQFTKMSVNGLDVAEKTPASPTFTDVPTSNIFYSYIEGAAAAGLVNGTGSGKFSPNSAISRQNVAAILGRWLSQAELDARGYLVGATGTHYASIDAWFAAEGTAQLAIFTDRSSVSEKMKPWVAYLAYLGISKGSNGLFSPASNITRAQAAVLILRTLDVGKSFGATVPTVTSINPTTGAAVGGTVVLITGTNFTSDATVKFGTKAATNVTFNSATQIVATSPAGTANTTVQVLVTTTAGTSANTAADDFTYGSAVPTVTALGKSAGPAAGGTEVLITGTNFTSDATVKFGTVAATSVTYTSATKLTAVAPAGTEGSTVDVLVTTPVGTSTNTSADNYAYGKPVVSSISPVTGPVAGGTSVTINGTGFTDDATVMFGSTNVTSANVTVDSPTKITAKSPVGTAGKMVQVSVTNDAGTSADTTNDNFTYAGTGPSISSLTPSAGDSGGGDEVVIKGVNFPTDEDDELTVYFGSRVVDPDDIELDSATQMTIESTPAPVTEYTVVDVSIVTEKGASANTPADDYSYGEPVITAISPNFGDPVGGYNMIITGTGYTADAKVFWDGDALAAAKFTVNGPTQITVVVPAGDDGDSIDVMVENEEGESNEEEFEYDEDLPYVTSISPTAGDSDGGDTVTINGTNFPDDEDEVTVYFGTETVDEDDITSITTTKIVVKAPAPVDADDDTTEVVDVMVETDEGESPDTPADDYSYGRATVESIEPNTGDPAGGTVVTIIGTGFVKGVSVYFDSTLVDTSKVTVVSRTEILVVAPAGTDGDDARVKVKNAEGTSADGDSDDDEFTYDEDYNAPIVTSVTPDSGPAAGGTVVTIEGSKFTIGAQVYFGSTQATDVDYVSPTELLATAPVGTDGKKVHITVKVGGVSSDTDFDNDAFTYDADDDIILSSASPAYGLINGGGKVKINETGFSSTPTVKFIGDGGTVSVPAEDVKVVSATQIEVVVPALGSADFAEDDLINISVKNTENTDILENEFQYFTYTVEYSDGSWHDLTGTVNLGATDLIDLRLRVLDGSDAPLTSLDLTPYAPMLYRYKASTTNLKVDPNGPSGFTTDGDGYLLWNGFGGYTGITYTVYVGFDLTGDGDPRDSDDVKKNASVIWASS